LTAGHCASAGFGGTSFLGLGTNRGGGGTVSFSYTFHYLSGSSQIVPLEVSNPQSLQRFCSGPGLGYKVLLSTDFHEDFRHVCPDRRICSPFALWYPSFQDLLGCWQTFGGSGEILAVLWATGRSGHFTEAACFRNGFGARAAHPCLMPSSKNNRRSVERRGPPGTSGAFRSGPVPNKSG